ncbi:MAG: hypothetical protein HY315_07055 [Acidobacteria bacterium]|nr:hypothetical protein [Acidobacteriota bacterium]
MRRFRTRLEELEHRLSSEAQRRQEFESAVDLYYVPNWRDATERLGVSAICTCPPYRYRSSCLKHSPEMLKRQVNTLKQIEGEFFESGSPVRLSS